MKIICIGWNYPLHNQEMKRDFEITEPSVFMKPDSALLRENKPFFIPKFTNQLEYETEVVVRINRLGKNIAEKFAHRYYNEIALGVDFTARDLQKRQKSIGGPWEISKAFDNSAVISDFIPLTDDLKIDDVRFSLKKNGELVQSASTSQMIFSVDRIIEYVSRYFTLKIGDLIYTGTPAGVGAVAINDRLEGYIEDRKMFDFLIK